MAETGKKMSDYTPLESNKKEYFLGDGEGSVVAVGKTDAAGEKTNRLVKLSDVAGDKLPSGGSEGQVLTKTSSGEAWADVPAGGYTKKPDLADESGSGTYVFTVDNRTYTKLTLRYHDCIIFSVNTASADTVDAYIEVEIHSQYASSTNSLLIEGRRVPGVSTSFDVLMRHVSGDEYTVAPGEKYVIHAIGECWTIEECAPDLFGKRRPMPVAESSDEGKVLTVTSADGKIGWDTVLPSGGSTGDVLTKTANGVAWDTPSGGGSGGYTKVAKASSYSNRIETVDADNNAYNEVSTTINKSASTLKINLVQTDMPDTFIEIKTNQSSWDCDLYDIKVYNGSTELKRLKFAGALLEDSGAAPYSSGDNAWEEQFSAKDTLLIRVIGKMFTVYCNYSSLHSTYMSN